MDTVVPKCPVLAVPRGRISGRRAIRWPKLASCHPRDGIVPVLVSLTYSMVAEGALIVSRDCSAVGTAVTALPLGQLRRPISLAARALRTYRLASRPPVTAARVSAREGTAATWDAHGALDGEQGALPGGGVDTLATDTSPAALPTDCESWCGRS